MSVFSSSTSKGTKDLDFLRLVDFVNLTLECVKYEPHERPKADVIKTRLEETRKSVLEDERYTEDSKSTNLRKSKSLVPLDVDEEKTDIIPEKSEGRKTIVEERIHGIVVQPKLQGILFKGGSKTLSKKKLTKKYLFWRLIV